MRFGVLLTTFSALPALAAQVVVADVTYAHSAPAQQRSEGAPVESRSTLTRVDTSVVPPVVPLRLHGFVALPAGQVSALRDATWSTAVPSVPLAVLGPCGVAVAFLMRRRRQAT
jgi:hypothetical protein